MTASQTSSFRWFTPIKLAALSGLLFLQSLPITPTWGANLQSLSPDEQQWLEQHNRIRIAYDGAFPPYSFINENGELQGIAVDFMNLISQRLDVNFETSPSLTWTNVYKAGTTRKIDVIATMVDRPDRHLWFKFTQPYLTKSLVIVTRKDRDDIKTRDDISGHRIVLNKNYEYTRRVRRDFPKIKPVLVASMKEGFEAVNNSKADAAITFLATSNYLQHTYDFKDLIVADFYERNSANESIAIRSDWPILADILQKALDSITEAEKQVIFAKWMPPVEPEAKTEPQTQPLPDPIQATQTTTQTSPSPGLDQPVETISKIDNYNSTTAAIIGLLLSVGWLGHYLYLRNTINKLRHNEANINQQIQGLQTELTQWAEIRAQEVNSVEAKFRNLLENLRHDYFFYQKNTEGRLTFVSPAVTSILGYHPDDFIAHYPEYLTDHPINAKLGDHNRQCGQGLPCPAYALEIRAYDDSIHWLEIIDKPVYDEFGNCIRIDGLVHDIRDNKHSQHLDFYDELSGLATPYLFDAFARQTLYLCQRRNSPCALMYLQISFGDNYQMLDNNLRLHAMLTLVKRLRDNVRISDIVGRLNQHRFALLLPGSDRYSALLTGQKINAILDQPIVINDETITSTSILGIAAYPMHGATYQELETHAEAALLYANQEGLGVVAYTEETMGSTR